MRSPLFITVIIYCIFISLQIYAESKNFRIPYYQQFFELNPQSLKTSSGQYFYQNLFRNLLSYSNEKGLIPDLAKKCTWINDTRLVCELKKDLKWSDGSALLAQDFITSYKSFLHPDNSNSRKDMLFNIKGAKDYSLRKTEWPQVGIKTIKKNSIEFSLQEPDPDFEFVLTQVMTAPFKEVKKITDFKQLLTTGPFKIKDFKKSNQTIVFEKNDYYLGSKTDILVEWVYLTEDTLQLPLYLNKELDFVRRLPTSQIKSWENKKDFYSQAVLRFDYFGFNLSLVTKEQRSILFTKIPFTKLKDLFSSRGRPGCFQLDKEFTGKEELCYPVEPAEPSDKELLKGLKAEFLLSQAGGEDHQRASEWIQSQWKEKFNFNASIRILENKIFLQHLKNNLPAFYRKGMPLEASSCYAAVKMFEPNSSENLNKIDNKELNSIVTKLKIEKNKSKNQKLCLDALSLIMAEYYIIPTGKFDLAYLIRPEFKGLNFNKLNFLDLSKLKYLN